MTLPRQVVPDGKHMITRRGSRRPFYLRREQRGRWGLRLRGLLDTMSNMKTATVRQVQHALASVLAEVQKGQEIAVTRRGKIVARIVPATGAQGRLRWPDSAARMNRLMSGATVKGMAPSELVRDLRGERL